MHNDDINWTSWTGNTKTERRFTAEAHGQTHHFILTGAGQGEGWWKTSSPARGEKHTDAYWALRAYADYLDDYVDSYPEPLHTAAKAEVRAAMEASRELVHARNTWAFEPLAKTGQ